MARNAVLRRYLLASFGLRFALAAALFGIVPAWIAVSEGRLTHRRSRDFYAVQSEVLAKQRVGGRGGPYHYLIVRYIDRAGDRHLRRVPAARRDAVGLRQGDRTRIYVSGADLGDVWLASGGPPGYRRSFVFGGFAVVLFLPLAAVLEWLRRRARVLRDGQPIAGRVEKVGRDRRTRFSTKCAYQLTWSCTGPDGRPRKGRSLHIPKQRAAAWKQGDEILVYMDPSHPLIAEVDVYRLR